MTTISKIQNAPDGIVLVIEKAGGGIHRAFIGKTSDCLAELSCVNSGLSVIGEAQLNQADTDAVVAAHKALV